MPEDRDDYILKSRIDHGENSAGLAATTGSALPALDWTVEKMEDGTWEVWTPDFCGACIGSGPTQTAAIERTRAALLATAQSMPTGQLVNAPAVCEKCHTTFVSPTTGQVWNKCYCGGELIPQNSVLCDSTNEAKERK